jgi:hypothetical protein
MAMPLLTVRGCERLQSRIRTAGRLLPTAPEQLAQRQKMQQDRVVAPQIMIVSPLRGSLPAAALTEESHCSAPGFNALSGINGPTGMYS